MNDERFIEKLLRRYATKRQADAGGPLEMHPATRRLLQAEVARRFAKPAPQQPGRVVPVWQRFWRSWGRPLAWATPVLVAAGVVIWALQQNAHKTESVSEAKSPAPAAIPEGNVPSAATADRLLRATAPKSAPTAVARSSSPDALSPVETRATPPAATAAPAVEESFKALESAAAVARPSEERRVEPAAPPPAEFAAHREFPTSLKIEPNFGLAETAKSQAEEQLVTFSRAVPPVATNVVSQAFVNAAPVLAAKAGAPAAARASVEPASAEAAAQVLSRFQIVQADNQLRIVDADGSVYLAELVEQPAATSREVSGEPAADKSPANRAVGRETPRERPSGRASSPAAAASPDSALGAQNVAQTLRAVGTNLTLNQPVEFVWSFAPLTNGMLAQGGRLRSGAPGPGLQQVRLPVPPSVGVWGRARIGNTQVLEVRAVPENSQ
jgi:hypothetical protein